MGCFENVRIDFPHLGKGKLYMSATTNAMQSVPTKIVEMANKRKHVACIAKEMPATYPARPRCMTRVSSIQHEDETHERARELPDIS